MAKAKKKGSSKTMTKKRPATKKGAAKKAPAKKSAGKSKPAPRPKPKAKIKPGIKAKVKAKTIIQVREVPALPPPNAIGLFNHHSDFCTPNVDALKRFYVDGLGFSTFTVDPNFGYLMVQTSAGASLGFMQPMSAEAAQAAGMDPAMAQGMPPKEPTIYFMVADVDKAHAKLVAKGITFQQGPTDQPWGHRTAMTMDPDGRMVMLATPKQP